METELLLAPAPRKNHSAGGSTFHLDSEHFSSSHFCAFLSHWKGGEIIGFVLSGVMGFVCEAGEALRTPGTVSLPNNPIYTEIEVNKAGTYFPTRGREGLFPHVSCEKVFLLQTRKKERKISCTPLKTSQGDLGKSCR